MDLTLLEVSLDGAQITANAPFSGRGSSDEAADDVDAESEDASSIAGETPDEESKTGSPIVAALVVLAVLGIVALVKRRSGRSDEQASESAGEEPIEVA